MLKEIVFLIWNKTLLDKTAEWKRKNGAENGNIHIWGRGVGKDGSRAEDGEKQESDEFRDGGIMQMEAQEEEKSGEEKKAEQPRCLEKYEKESTLFVTDKGEILQELKKTGRYIIALLYEGNEQEDFSGAPYAVTNLNELTVESFDQAYRRMAGLPWTVLETARCIVRETTVADVDEFYRIYAEPSITYYMDRLYDDPEQERAYAREYIEKIYGFYGYGMWSIVQKESGRVIGRAGLSWREGFDVPEIGYVIEAPCQGMGYAYEVCSAILKYGMEELEFQKIQALVEPGNEASVRLCRKLGMEWEETVKDREKVYDRFVIEKVIEKSI